MFAAELHILSIFACFIGPRVTKSRTKCLVKTRRIDCGKLPYDIRCRCKSADPHWFPPLYTSLINNNNKNTFHVEIER